jgi:hypothetical protein
MPFNAPHCLRSRPSARDLFTGLHVWRVTAGIVSLVPLFVTPCLSLAGFRYPATSVSPRALAVACHRSHFSSLIRSDRIGVVPVVFGRPGFFLGFFVIRKL